jgi:hypothetical protein
MTPLPLTNGAFFVSNTFLETIQKCPTESNYYKLLARTSAAPAPAPTFGSHLHSALEMYYRLQEFNLSSDEILSRVSDLMTEEFQREPIDESDFRNLNWCMEIFQKYTKKFEFEEVQLMKYDVPTKCKYCIQGQLLTADGVNAVATPCPWCNATGFSNIMCEVPFVFKLFDYDLTSSSSSDWADQVGGLILPVYMHGFIDLPVTLQGQLFSLDFKSTSLLGNGFWDEKKVSAQQKGYVKGAIETTGLDFKGYIVRAIRVNAPPKYVTDGTANKKGEFKKISDWWDECFPEERFFVTECELEEWKLDAISHVKEFFYHYSNNYFPHRRTACSGKFGRCQYWDVCTTFPPEDRSLVLDSGLYKNKENKTPNIEIIK